MEIIFTVVVVKHFVLPFCQVGELVLLMVGVGWGVGRGLLRGWVGWRPAGQGLWI